ncbi:MAG: NAD-binding protein, partial [Microcystaceae cyanobacterium]
MTTSDFFLVCGLGSLGQQCVVALDAFGVKVIAIERHPIEAYDIPSVPDLLAQLIIGDCSYLPVLETLPITNCRAALLVTSQDQVNIETALLIRKLSLNTRLVVRSGQNNLNELLSEQLGNFVAYEPLDLPANAFALAALGSNTLGFFELNHQNLRVTRTVLSPDHPWLKKQKIHELNAHNRRILSVQGKGDHSSFSFHQWDGERSLAVDELVICVELVDNFDLSIQALPMGDKTNSTAIMTKDKKPLVPLVYLEKWQQFKLGLQSRPIILFSGGVILSLLVLGTILLYLTLPGIDLIGAFYRTVVLLLGGYGDLLADIHDAKESRWILEPLALSLTLAGIAFVGILYASLTESLLAAKFNFARKRLPIPKQNHVIILGLGRVGQRVARLLKKWKQPIVGITLKSDFDPRILLDIPVLTQTLEDGLPKANLA